VDALGINFGYLLVQILNFAIIFVVLRAWVYKPVLNLLQTRRETIAQGLEDARVAAEARANAEKEAEQVLADAQAEAGGIVREATERAESAVKDVRTAAEAEIAAARQAGTEESAEERNRMLGELRGQVAALSMAAAQKLVGDALDEQRQRSLISEFFSGVRSGNVMVLEGESLSGASAEVVSALPLTADEQETVKNDVLSKVGSQSSVAFRVDPTILGGLVIQVGDKVLDGSVAGQLESLRENLR
jgi:F-type H+-transporting ATPase subunit b